MSEFTEEEPALTVDELKHKITKLEGLNISVMEQWASANKNAQGMQARLQQKEQLLKTLESEKTNLEAQLRNMQGTGKGSEEALQEQLRIMEQQGKAKEEALQGQLRIMEEQLTAVKKEYTELQHRIQKPELQQVKYVSDLKEQQAKEMSDLKEQQAKEMSDLKEQLRVLQEKLNMANKDWEERLFSSVAGIDALKAHMQKALTEKEKEIHRLNANLDAVNITVQKLQESLSRLPNTSTWQFVRAQLEIIDGANTNIRTQISSNEVRLGQAVSIFSSFSKEIREGWYFIYFFSIYLGGVLFFDITFDIMFCIA